MGEALQHLVNHISLVVDRSGSMSSHRDKVIQVFDRELNALKQRSFDVHQETRISIYLFDDKVRVLTFDMDVARFTSLKDYYTIGGQTALLDAVVSSITDNQKVFTAYGDHAFLTYVITDGYENASKLVRPDYLRDVLSKLPDNWTNAILVPDNASAQQAQNFGFNAGSISVWNTSGAKAIENLGDQFTSVTTGYMNLRSQGIRGTKNLFTLDPAKVAPKAAKLNEVPPTAFDIYPVRQTQDIKSYVESWTKEKYRIGSTYYQPTKAVTLQDWKQILVQDTKTGRVYEGDNIRQLLGLPDYTVDVNPLNHRDFRLFIQSASVNRKLFKDTFILVRK